MAFRCAITTSGLAELACTMTAARRSPATAWAARISSMAGRVASAVTPTTSGQVRAFDGDLQDLAAFVRRQGAASPNTPRTVSPVAPMAS